MKKLTVGILCGLAITLSGVTSYGFLEAKKETASRSAALAVPGYDELDKLVEESNTIITGVVPSEYEEVEVPFDKEDPTLFEVDRIYHVEVTKNFKGPDETQYKKGDFLELVIQEGIRQRKDGELGEIFPFDEQLYAFDNKEYMLFLNKGYHGGHKEDIFVLQNTNHIYLKEGTKLKNQVSDKLIEIDEEVVESKLND